MTRMIVPAAVLLVGLALEGLGEQPGKDPRGLEQKLLGEWKGRTTCDGRLVFRADGTYALTEYGPANDDSRGTWKVRGDALPATLVLVCKTSEVEDQVGKTTEVKLVQLDAKRLAIEYATPNGSPSGHYTPGEEVGRRLAPAPWGQQACPLRVAISPTGIRLRKSFTRHSYARSTDIG
jgi:hypothetical protein